MKIYRLMLGVAGLLVCILPVSAQAPAPRGSDATEPPVSGFGDAQSITSRESESGPNATGPGGIEYPTDATADGSRAGPQAPDNGGTLNSRARSNAR